MRKIIILILLLFSFFCQSSEAGFFTFNFQEKLHYADQLNFEFNRPLAAEMLINEVIKYCEKKNNEYCLADAYSTYGNFLASESVGDSCKWNKNFCFGGFLDKAVTCDNRYQKSLEYYERALFLAQKQKIYDRISGIYASIAILRFLHFNDKESFCSNFDRSLEYHLLFKKTNPDERVILPEGFKSYEEYILNGKKEANCP